MPGGLWASGVKALIAMSGGVDSSVAAYLMGERGDSCIGITTNLLGREDADTLKIEFDVSQRAITRGQAVVLYDGDLVAGGGTTQ